MGYQDSDRYRPSPPPAAAAAWVLAGGLAVALVAGGLAALYLWPKKQEAGYDSTAQPREAAPKTGYDGEEREAIDLFKGAKESVVNVDTVVLRRNRLDMRVEALQAGTGSGFIWDDEGRIVTNFHVIREAIQRRLALRVVLADRSEWKVTVIGVAPEYDLAVIQIKAPASQLKKIKVGTSNDLQVGQKVYALGNPFGLSLTLTKGIISALDREIESPAGQPISGVIQTDAPINPGNSGGPLLDKDGRLIGVNTAIATAQSGGGSVGIGFAVPVDTVNRVVPELIRAGKLLKPDMGITLVDQVRLRRADYTTGVMIATVEPNGPAANAGLQPLSQDRRTGQITPGDLILAINGEEVKGNAEFDRMMNRFKPGDQLKLTVERNEQRLEVTVTLRGV
jgi:S1-C subfamily serine protease